MSGKYMKIKRIIIPTITMLIIASQLFGCSSASKQEAYDMLQQSTEIELEVAVPETESDTIDEELLSSLEWIELGSLTTYESIRTEWDSILGITGTTGNKEGMLYTGWEGSTQDNYLAQVISMQEFVKFASEDDNYNALIDAVRNSFVDSDDLTDQQLFSIGLNAYFNLLPMEDESESHANDFISRAQFLSIITRATNPVSVEKSDEYEANLSQLKTLAGESVYNESVAMSLNYSYLTTDDGSLNTDTYGSSISRGEAIYTIMQMIYGEEALASADINSAVLSDTKNGGDIKSAQNLSSNAQVIRYALQNPDKGCPEDIYRALVKANELGLITDETAWDEAITLSDAISFYYDTTVSKLFTDSSTATNTTTSESDSETSTSESNTETSTSESISEAPTSELWPEYAETYEYMKEHTNYTIAHMLNPDVYGVETAGKATNDFHLGQGKPDAAQYIKRMKTTTTKGYYIQAFWYVETNTVQFIYDGEVSPAGGWFTDMDSTDALNEAYNNMPVMDMTHQQKIDALGEPSLTPEEVIEYIQANGMS